MENSSLKKIFIILVDISGYTRFIKYHNVSLLHAEKIIGELMESILQQVEIPVTAHEILGDAISFYAIDENSTGDKIYNQIERYFEAFREREAELISACGLCRCDACRQVGQLKLKAILHFGEAAFTKVQHIQKISGRNIILSHRLLKNTLNSSEYIIMTPEFIAKCNTLQSSDLTPHKEFYPDLGTLSVYVKKSEADVKAAPVSLLKKLADFLVLEFYMLKQLINSQKEKPVFRNLPQSK